MEQSKSYSSKNVTDGKIFENPPQQLWVEQVLTKGSEVIKLISNH